ncbi:MAG: HlyD family efflux transporter periplasmic adaptor subunit [Oscillospiraceae bacterium]|jgi:multidrug efflux pump subunit AcrA (membrane-fusion protein)|nr:HlyD family efflux transporter periplasmic adaptor subunit [Oscillospiraceae bacterium]
MATAEKTRKKKKLMIGGVVLLVVAAVVFATFGKGGSAALTVRAIPLERQTLSNTVSATGAVESSEDHKVYSTVTSPVKEINVKVGDRVEAGQVLAQLDTETLELNIAQSEATINQSKNVAYQQIKQAQKNLDNAKKTLEAGLNSSAISAESGVNSAEINKENAALSLRTAEDNQEATEDMVGSYRDAYYDARSDYQSAKAQYEKAKKAYDNSVKGTNSAVLESFNRQIKDAQAGYQDQLKNVAVLLREMQSCERDLNVRTIEADNAQKAVDADPDNTELKKLLDEALEDVAKAQENFITAEEEYKAADNIAENMQLEIIDLKSQMAEYEQNFGITEAAKALEAATQVKDAAEAAMLSAQSRLESTRTQIDQADMALDQAELGKKSADTSYETSLKQQQATLEGINQQIESYEDALTSSRIQADTTAQEISLQLLYKQLEDSTITSPITGVVTAVNAEEGVPANGVMFVIEDVEQLEISTSIKEYDVTTVKEGMPVVIRTDAIDGEEFEGVLSEIAPTGVKNASGGAVTFAAKVTIPKPGALRVGMNTRMDIVLEEKENVFRVPFDAVHTAEDESFYITAVVPNESGEKNAAPFVTKNIPVTTGMETDFYVEILSDELEEGMQIIPSGDVYAEGTPVQVM